MALCRVWWFTGGSTTIN